MAAKKTAKKTTEPAPVEPVSATTPVARKAAKKAVKKVATKTSAPKSEKSPAPKAEKPAAPKAAAKPSADAIARAAYLNYRRRVEQGLPGDSHGDWLAAEQQLG